MVGRIKSTRLTAKSSFADIVVAYGFATRRQVNHARAIRQSELDSITPRDERQGRRARMLGEVLMDLIIMDLTEVNFCLKVERTLKA